MQPDQVFDIIRDPARHQIQQLAVEGLTIPEAAALLPAGYRCHLLSRQDEEHPDEEQWVVCQWVIEEQRDPVNYCLFLYVNQGVITDSLPVE